MTLSGRVSAFSEALCSRVLRASGDLGYLPNQSPSG